MIGYNRQNTRLWQLTGLVLMVVLWASGALAQTVEFDQLVVARETTALLEHDGLVIGGIGGGGLVFWNAADHTEYERLTSGLELSANDVTDLVWTGRNVWVATNGGGLTKITDVAGDRSYRLYTTNVGDLSINAVTGLIVGSSEWVYYGMTDGGVGVITDGLSGAVWTAEQDGLISNNVNSVQVFDGDLFVATPVGISRFANNLFTDQNTGLGSLEVHDLQLDSDGNLLAGTQAGLFQWDPAVETWSMAHGNSDPIAEISCSPGLIYVRSGNSVQVYNGISWQSFSTPSGSLGAIYAGDDFWIGGQASSSVSGQYTIRNAYLGRLGGGSTFEVEEIQGSQVTNVAGVAFSGSNPYVGSWVWFSVISGYQDGAWNHVRYKSDNSDNASLSPGQILVMDSGPDLSVWASVFHGTGLARITPSSGLVDLITPLNSGLQGGRVIGIEVHPDGPVITTHDWDNAEKVEVLVDPSDWGNSAQWMTLPLDGGLGPAVNVWDAVVQRRDVVWFAVQDVGVVRWDINGDQAGPDDPLTWLDQSDDRWDPPLLSLDGSTLNLGNAVSLEVGEDGSIWVGGNGLLQFSYDESDLSATVMSSISEKVTSLSAGLVNGNVRDIVRDSNGDIWVTTATGVNRVRGSGLDLEIDTYIDLGNFFTNPNYSALYSFNVISPLPGVSYGHIAASADRRRIIVGADQGASVITVDFDTPVDPSTDTGASSVYLYPNPYLGQAEGLKLGQLPAGVEAEVDIYNIDGQRVYSESGVTNGTAFWQGQNRKGEAVVTGLYVVRISAGNSISTLTLSVVR